jgi:homoserine O-acetyltransferase/O-succinyltransferase
MNSHDVGRGRGGVARALSRVTAQLVVVAVDSDRLYPPRLSEEIAVAAGSVDCLRVITSDYGHDGFLIEIDQVGRVVRDTLTRLRAR